MGGLIFNVLQLAADLAALAAVRKAPRAVTVVSVLAVGGFGSLVMAVVFGFGFFGMLRLIAYTVFVHGPLLLGAFAWLCRGTSKPAAWALGSLAVLTAAVGVDAFFIEPYRLEITRVRVVSPKLKVPLRIGVLSDLQADQIGAHEERALRALMAEKPDLILLPGDFIQTPDRARVTAEARELFRRVGLAAPRGVYAVQGDVDLPGWTKLFDGLGATCFERTGSVEVAGLRITGLSFEDGDNPGMVVPASDLFQVVFAHRPDFALGDVKGDLLVAGHTHGGQVRLPGIGPIVTMSRIPRSWAAGATRLGGGRTLVVTRGVGMERGAAPRLRFLCPPEITVIELVPGVE